MADVSVVIPFYNRAAFARRLLDSVLRQSLLPASVVFVDNGSCERERQQLTEILQSTDSNGVVITYLETDRKGNANIARNLGLRSATTRYVAFLDSDDWWEPAHIERSLVALCASDKTGVYGGSIVHAGQVYVNASADLNELPTPFDLLFSKCGHSAQTSTFVVDVHRLGGVLWDEKLRRHQDYDFFLAVAHGADGWCFNSEPTGHLDRTEAIEGRQFDFRSMIRFLNKWKSGFPHAARQVYLISQLDACLISSAPSFYYRYYRRLFLDSAGCTAATVFSTSSRWRRVRLKFVAMSKRLKIYSVLKRLARWT